MLALLESFSPMQCLNAHIWSKENVKFCQCLVSRNAGIVAGKDEKYFPENIGHRGMCLHFSPLFGNVRQGL
jgi:hypothetical protein